MRSSMVQDSVPPKSVHQKAQRAPDLTLQWHVSTNTSSKSETSLTFTVSGVSMPQETARKQRNTRPKNWKETTPSGPSIAYLRQRQRLKLKTCSPKLSTCRESVTRSRKLFWQQEPVRVNEKNDPTDNSNQTNGIQESTKSTKELCGKNYQTLLKDIRTLKW